LFTLPASQPIVSHRKASFFLLFLLTFFSLPFLSCSRSRTNTRKTFPPPIQDCFPMILPLPLGPTFSSVGVQLLRAHTFAILIPSLASRDGMFQRFSVQSKLVFAIPQFPPSKSVFYNLTELLFCLFVFHLRVLAGC